MIKARNAVFSEGNRLIETIYKYIIISNWTFW